MKSLRDILRSLPMFRTRSVLIPGQPDYYGWAGTPVIPGFDVARAKRYVEGKPRVAIGSNYPPVRDPIKEAQQACQIALHEAQTEARLSMDSRPVLSQSRVDYATAGYAYTPTGIDRALLLYTAFALRLVSLITKTK